MMTEQEVVLTYRFTAESWPTMRQQLVVPDELVRKGRGWVVTDAGLTKICRALRAQDGPPSDPKAPEGVETPPEPPRRRGYLIPLHAGPCTPAPGAVFDMKIVRCWPAIPNDRVVQCLLPGTDPGHTSNFVTVRLRGPGAWLHNYRHGMVLRARLEPDGFWTALRPAPNLPGRWTHNNYLP